MGAISQQIGGWMGKGRKQCPKCKTMNGVRSYICSECGYMFEINDIKSKILKMNAPKLYTCPPGVLIIHVPAGKCPVAFNKSWLSASIQQLKEWAKMVRRAKLTRENVYVSNNALKLYLQHYFPKKDIAYSFACDLIDEHVTEEFY